MKKDKQKVLGEVFDEDRVRGFLTQDAPAGVSPDFHCLERAYRGMKVENFKSFIGYFVEEGRNLNATNDQGRTLLSLIQEHRRSIEYAQIMEQAGATTEHPVEV